MCKSRGDGDGEVDDAEDVPLVDDKGNPIPPAVRAATIAKRARARTAARVQGRQRQRTEPLSTKPGDYQIRVHIIQGRSLAGSAIDPVGVFASCARGPGGVRAGGRRQL